MRVPLSLKELAEAKLQAQRKEEQERAAIKSTIGELLKLADSKILAQKILEHSGDMVVKLIKELPGDKIDELFIETLRQKYNPALLPLEIIQLISVKGKSSLLSDIEAFIEDGTNPFKDKDRKISVAPELILAHLSKDGPITPELAVNAFPRNIEILKKACELNPDATIEALEENPFDIDMIEHIDPRLIKDHISTKGAITPELAVKTFPQNIDIIKKACELDPNATIKAMRECAVAPTLVIGHVSKEGPITPKVAIHAFSQNIEIIKKACEVDPDSSSKALNEARTDPILIIRDISLAGPITPAIAIKAFPQNETIIKKACSIDPDATIKATNECKTNPDLIVKCISKEGPITTDIAIKMVQGSQKHIAQVLSKEIMKDSWTSDVKDKVTTAVNATAEFLAQDKDISIKEIPTDEKKIKLLLDLHQQYQKLNKESSDMHKQKKEVIKAAMKSLVTGDARYLTNVLGKSNSEQNQQFDVRKYISWAGVSQTETLAIRTLSQLHPLNEAAQTNQIDKFKEIKGNFKKLLSGLNRTETQSAAEAPRRDTNDNDNEMEPVSSYHKFTGV